ncbi:response regulator transcription factor [Actinoplanes solisilvae]|uniref:response regulator transcription factor n=1 Tax=Actinoplanes solisilvae TaxID=2486853 RepID=UPI000FDCD092|nr:response regulator transcription factor [Actinoplanes solisilvae]
MTSAVIEPTVVAATSAAVRVVVADDHALVREGLTRVLERGGIEVEAVASTADGLLGLARAYRPDVVVTDLGQDGREAALELRRTNPEIALVVLSPEILPEFAVDLVEGSVRGVGYLLKEKVETPDLLVDAVRRVAAGGTVLDPDVISRLVRRGRPEGPLDRLTGKEREVLALMSQGRSNAGIAAQLFVTVPAVERHVTGIFTKLGLQRSGNLGHRRVLAVLTYLRGGGALT